MSRKTKFELSKGDVVTLFNNTYKVVSSGDVEQVMLQDVKGTSFCMPAKKLKFLMERSLAKSSSSKSDLKKFVEKKKEELELIKGPSAPLYSVYMNKMKVQMDPPRWVSMETGRSYDMAEQDDKEHHHDLHHQVDLDHALKFHQTISTKAHPEDQEQLKKLVNGFLGKQRASINMKDVAKGWTGGGKQASKEQLDTVFKINNEATEHWNKFSNAYKASLKKLKSKR